jgi:hypothetical protein
MRPVFVVVEGPTEKEFIDECLKPYWIDNYGLYDVQVRILGMPGKKGGDVRVARLRKDVELLLKQRSDAFVTTLVDYYGIRTDIPDYEKCQNLPVVDRRIECLEKGLYKLIGSEQFIPYLQKYEFETLLFASGNSLAKYLTPKSCAAIEQIKNEFRTAETINTSNPPSYRLAEIISKNEPFRYRKVAYGSTLALEIGLPTILQECPRFAAWVERIGKLATIPPPLCLNPASTYKI